MATAIFHSNRGTKSALLLVRANAFVFQATPCYVPREAVANLSEGDTLEIPDGYSFVEMLNEDGTPRTTEPDKDGNITTLKMLHYA